MFFKLKRKPKFGSRSLILVRSKIQKTFRGGLVLQKKKKVFNFVYFLKQKHLFFGGGGGIFI